MNIPYSCQFIDKEDINSVCKAIKSDWITQGPFVEKFEQSLANYSGAKYGVAVSSGTSALHLAYLTIGIKKDDEVIIPANTFVATANMTIACGAKPVFCDIRLDTYNIDESKIEKLITKKTKAIVAVHFAGHPCNMREIWRIARRHNLKVVEDAAHALGSGYENKKIGNSKSNITVFSFHPVKSITTGEGGAVITNNKNYYEKLIKLRSHGISKDKQGLNRMDIFGYNYRLTDIQAALGLSQLNKLNSFIDKRTRVAEFHFSNLKQIEQIILPQEMDNVKSAWHLFVIRLKNKAHRIGLRNYLKDKGISTQIHYPAVYSHPYYKKNGYKKTNCKNAEIYSSTCLSIPIYPFLTKKQSLYIASIIKSYFKT